MPFFNQANQQQLMQQMFSNPQGGPMPPMPGGQGGIAQGDGGQQLAPSFESPDMAQGGNAIGVAPPDQFVRPAPNIGDEAMMRQVPNIGDGAMMRGQGAMPQDLGAGGGGPGMGAISDEDRQRLIQAIIARSGGAF